MYDRCIARVQLSQLQRMTLVRSGLEPTTSRSMTLLQHNRQYPLIEPVIEK